MGRFDKRFEHCFDDFTGHIGDDMRRHDWLGQAEVEASGGDEDLYAGMPGGLRCHDHR